MGKLFFFFADPMYNCRIRRRFFLLVGLGWVILGPVLVAGYPIRIRKISAKVSSVDPNIECDPDDSGIGSLSGSPERNMGLSVSPNRNTDLPGSPNKIVNPIVSSVEEKADDKVLQPITVKSFEKEKAVFEHEEFLCILKSWLVPDASFFYEDCHESEYHISCSIQIDKCDPETIIRFPNGLHWDNLKIQGTGTQEQLAANLQAFIQAMGSATVKVLEFSQWNIIVLPKRVAIGNGLSKSASSDSAFSDSASSESEQSESVAIGNGLAKSASTDSAFSDSTSNDSKQSEPSYALPRMEKKREKVRVGNLRIKSLSSEALHIIISACAEFQFTYIYFFMLSPCSVSALDILRCGEVEKVWIIGLRHPKEENEDFFSRVQNTSNAFWSAKEIQMSPLSWDNYLSFLLYRITRTLAIPIDLYTSIIISDKSFEIPSEIQEVRLYDISETNWEAIMEIEDEPEIHHGLLGLTDICLDFSFITKKTIGPFNMEKALIKLLKFLLHYHRGLFIIRLTGTKNLERQTGNNITETFSAFINVSLEQALSIPIVSLERSIKKVSNREEDRTEILIGYY